jgi:hypothetical protein
LEAWQTGAALARAGLDVTVLEAHIYPGGCAGTFYHQGYRFDAGATLAGGFYPGGPMDLLAERHWSPVLGLSPQPIRLWLFTFLETCRLLAGRTKHAGPNTGLLLGAQALGFWRWQENTADALWELALRTPSLASHKLGWKPLVLARDGLSWLASGGIRRGH